MYYKMSNHGAIDVRNNGSRQSQNYDVDRKLPTTKLPPVYVICFFLLLTMPTINALEEGESCSIKTFNGVCTPVSKCSDRIGSYISQGLITQNDVVNCGYTPYEEVICCPTELALAVTTTTGKTSSLLIQNTGATDWNDAAEFLDFQKILTTQKSPSPKEAKLGQLKSLSPTQIDNIQSIGPFGTSETDRQFSRKPVWQPRPVSSRELQFEELSQESEIDSFRPQANPVRIPPNHMPPVRPMSQLPHHHGRIPTSPWPPAGNLPEQSLTISNSIFSETMESRPQQQLFSNDNPNRHMVFNPSESMGPRQPIPSMQPQPIIDWIAHPQRQEEHQVQPQIVHPIKTDNDDLFYQGMATAFQQPPIAQDQAQQMNFNPIQKVNDKLLSQGINVIKAVPTIVGKPIRPTNEQMNLVFGTPEKSITNPFQFNEPQVNSPVHDIKSNGLDSSDGTNGGREFDFPDNNQDTSRNTRNKERVSQRVCKTITAGLNRSLTPHIINGIPARSMEYPHMAAIAYEVIGGGPTAYDFRCGGSLIDKRFVLTAAHCVISAKERPIFVRLGVIDTSLPLDKNGVDKNISEVNIHDNYTLTSKYDDIAILKLESEVILSRHIYPICLHFDINDPSNDAEYYVSGWGIFNLKSREKPHILLKTQLSIVPLSNCNESYSIASGGGNSQFALGLLQTQLCAANTARTSDACSGDSGGPLIRVIDETRYSYSVIGIVSAGFGCASSTPGLYTRVAAYLDYIESVVWPGQ